MAPSWVLVSSHERSGTHFLIDSLVLNHARLRFPGSRHLPKDFNLGSLLRNDRRVTQAFRRLLEGADPVIVKSHLRRADLQAAATAPGLDAEVRALLARVVRDAFKVYVWRDPRDVLVSLYHHAGYAGTFAAFLRAPSPNVARRPWLEVAGAAPTNTEALAAHVREGLTAGAHDAVVRYEELVRAHARTVRALLERFDGSQPVGGEVRRPRKRDRGTARLRRWLWRHGWLPRVEYSGFDGVRARQGAWKDYFSEPDLRYLTDLYPSGLFASSGRVP